MDEQPDWFWCLKHARPEHGPGCPSAVRLGPYPDERSAWHWRDRVATRNDAWEAEDRDDRGDGPVR